MNLKRRMTMACLLIIGGLYGCDGSYQIERENVERQDIMYAKNQPPPMFDWSLERHLMTELYSARNKAVATYSYVRNQYNGKVMSWCPSIGFPIPANAQLTNPQKVVHSNGGVVSQAEPNGLYTSPSTSGTYVMCVNKEGKVVPRYYEQHVEAYLVSMVEKNGILEEVIGAKPSLTIDPKIKIRR